MGQMRTGTTLPALLVSLLLATASAPAEESSLELSVLSYNTHGLPGWIAGDDPEGRFPQIAKLADRYDLVLLQEDFEHHALVRENTRHTLVFRGNPPRNGFGSGDGLTVLAGGTVHAAKPRLRHAYGTCSGWLSGANDCWANKGLFGVRITLTNGASLDVYDLHLEAGEGDGDRTVRHGQLDQVAEQIREQSGGQAIIVGGDFNMSFDDPEERQLMMRFQRDLGLQDSAIDPRDSPPWTKRIDYLFFRPGGSIELALLEAEVAKEFVSEGVPLSDHPALYGRFRVSDRALPSVATPGE
jgi:endonuclease/exonuclease/phosphatase family metal-dependent hydrolase